jgi:hypothetical protein
VTVQCAPLSLAPWSLLQAAANGPSIVPCQRLIRGVFGAVGHPRCPRMSTSSPQTHTHRLGNGPSWLHSQSRRPGEAHTAAQPLTKHSDCVSLAALAKMRCGIIPPRSRDSPVIDHWAEPPGRGRLHPRNSPFRYYFGRPAATCLTISLPEFTPFTGVFKCHQAIPWRLLLPWSVNWPVTMTITVCFGDIPR